MAERNAGKRRGAPDPPPSESAKQACTILEAGWALRGGRHLRRECCQETQCTANPREKRMMLVLLRPP